MLLIQSRLKRPRPPDVDDLGCLLIRQKHYLEKPVAPQIDHNHSDQYSSKQKEYGVELSIRLQIICELSKFSFEGTGIYLAFMFTEDVGCPYSKGDYSYDEDEGYDCWEFVAGAWILLPGCFDVIQIYYSADCQVQKDFQD